MQRVSKKLLVSYMEWEQFLALVVEWLLNWFAKLSHIKKIGVQSNTYFASALPWINKKTELILLGSNNYSLTPSLELVKEASKLGINAIILTHIGGYPIPEIQKITKFCNENQILLFEDCAHSPLTKIDNLYVGSFGDASIFSFFPTKPIPAGEGGMVLFKNQDLAKKVSLIRDYGKVNLNDKILHKLPAVSNGRLNEFSASIVSTFLENYKRIYLIRKEIASIYDDKIPNKLIYQKIFMIDKNFHIINILLL